MIINIISYIILLYNLGIRTHEDRLSAMKSRLQLLLTMHPPMIMPMRMRIH